jgi:hypothetical protein
MNVQAGPFLAMGRFRMGSRDTYNNSFILGRRAFFEERCIIFTHKALLGSRLASNRRRGIKYNALRIQFKGIYYVKNAEFEIFV